MCALFLVLCGACSGGMVVRAPPPPSSALTGSTAMTHPPAPAHQVDRAPPAPSVYDRLFRVWVMPLLRRYYLGLPHIRTSMGSFGGWENEHNAQVCARMFPDVGADVWASTPAKCVERIERRIVSWGLLLELVVLVNLALFLWRVVMARWLVAACAACARFVGRGCSWPPPPAASPPTYLALTVPQHPPPLPPPPPASRWKGE